MRNHDLSNQNSKATMSKLEQLVCSVFCKVLKIKNVNLDDDLIALGGDSIAGMEIYLMLDGYGLTGLDIAMLRTPRLIAKKMSENLNCKSRFDLKKYSVDNEVPLSEQQLNIYFDIVMNKEPFTADGLFKGFTNFLTGNGWSHLWYLYMLVGLYLLMPLFKKITEHVRVKELWYLLLILVFFLSLIPILKLWNIGTSFGIPVATIYPFYLFFGYTASRPEVKVSKWIAVICLVASTTAITALTLLRWNNPETMMNLEMFFSYSSILVILQATSIFYLFIKKELVPLEMRDLNLKESLD